MSVFRGALCFAGGGLMARGVDLANYGPDPHDWFLGVALSGGGLLLLAGIAMRIALEKDS